MMPPVYFRHGTRNILGSVFPGSRTRNESNGATEWIKGEGEFRFSTGKAALKSVLETMSELKPDRDEVIVPAYTCYSVAASIVGAGLKILPVEMEADTLDFDFAALEKAIGPRALAVISAHLFSLPVDVAQLSEIAKSVDCYVIEDCAQYPSGFNHGTSDPHVRICSFGRGKPVSGFGGGAAIVDDKTIRLGMQRQISRLNEAPKLSGIRSAFGAQIADVFGRPGWYAIPARLPFLGLGETHYPTSIRQEKISPFCSRLYDSGKQRIDDLQRHRRQISGIYRAGFRDAPGTSVPQRAMDEDYAGLRFPVYLLTRADLRLLRRYGVVKMYPSTLSEAEKIASECFSRKLNIPEATYIAEHLVTLPTHELVSVDFATSIVNVIKTQQE